MPNTTPEQITAFISRWETSGAAERANYQMFLSELCAIIGVPRPDPTSPDPAKNLYVFDRTITQLRPDGSSAPNYIDLYRARHFVCETKQGLSADASPDELAKPAATKTGHGKRGTLAFDKALERAFHQGRGYITALPPEEGRPPFLIVCDVGHSIDLYAEFTCTGGQYERFPDPVSYRITLPDLHRPEIRERLRKVWLDPHSLDPSKVAAKVTRDIAGRLALLAKSLETDGHDLRVIAGFLQRSLFTMFAEDVGLLPEDGFKSLLARAQENPRGFPVLVSALWQEMATGTHYSALLFKEIAHFNGGLFENTSALPLSAAQLGMLADAAATDWSGVEPSIFGTLLVRALDPRERHKLGAEYTPRSYVERLIRPTIIGPLREEWDAVRIAAATLHEEADLAELQADTLEADAKAKLAAGASAPAKQLGAEAARLRKDAAKKDAEALTQVIAFHRHLCTLTILDPACGTANFLYVTMEHMKRLEAEVLQIIDALGGDAVMEMQGFRVRPDHFIGLEINKQAVAIAQLVLWIGYFQWQHKTTGKADTGDRPLLPKDRSIFEQDAVLAYDERVPRRHPDTGEILTIWDGHTTKTHPITGKEVPDESATIALFDYLNPRRAKWPKADYIVGNPPFLGMKRLNYTLGRGYTEALRAAWKLHKPDAWDFVMYWWHHAAELVRDGKSQAFGFITTNSINQIFNRKCVEPFLEDERKPIHLSYAIADHPWIDSADGAAVRIAMTAGRPGQGEGILDTIISDVEKDTGEHEVAFVSTLGRISASLSQGASVSTSVPLLAQSGVSYWGVKFYGDGFIVTKEEADLLDPGVEPRIVRPFISGQDLTRQRKGQWAIDCDELSIETLEREYPAAFQHLLVYVKPVRDHNPRSQKRERWWIFGENQPAMRRATRGLSRKIVTTETAKFRTFEFSPACEIAEGTVAIIASDDASILGVLSSTIHIVWALKNGGLLGPTPRYNKTRCFETFPFPALEEGSLKQRIRDLGERLDAHRKRQQAQHPDLTLTGIYNVLHKLRSGEPLTAKDKTLHDQGLVSVLRQLHDDLDAAVLEAYGWGGLVAETQDFKTQDPRPGGSAPGMLSSSSSLASCVLQSCVSPADILARGGPAAEALEQALLTRLVALNHERAAEERRGLIRWLRPDYQNCSGGLRPSHDSDAPAPDAPLQDDLPGTESVPSLETENLKLETLAWPQGLPDQVAAIRRLLPTHGQDPETGPAELAERLAACFGRKSQKRTDQIAGILATLKALGHLA